MKIHFHGATGDVTGSAYHLVTKDASILVDCGLFQGGRKEKAKNRREAKLDGGKLDAVVLTIITHGEDRARKTFSELIRTKYGMRTECPNLGDVIEI